MKITVEAENLLELKKLLTELVYQPNDTKKADTISVKVHRGRPKGSKNKVKRFTAAARKALIKKGYVIYQLTGKSIKDLREEGNPFWSTWHNGEKFETIKSIKSEVAINPNPKKFFIDGSFNKNYSEQESLIKTEDKKLKVTGAKMIMAGASDWAEMAFLHYKKTNQRLFGEDYKTKDDWWSYTRTNTATSGSRVAGVGIWGDDGLGVIGWDRDYRSVILGAARWVVPD